MKPIEFLEQHREQIYKTAEYIATKENVPADAKMHEIENNFITNNGTRHLEAIELKQVLLELSSLLEAFRENVFERMMVYCFDGNSFVEINHVDGDQFSSPTDEAFFLKSFVMAKSRFPNLCDYYLYFCHNHPFMYRASPSKSDLNCYGYLMQLIFKMNKLDSATQFHLVDFGIVTPFDYWSAEQIVRQD